MDRRLLPERPTGGLAVGPIRGAKRGLQVSAGQARRPSRLVCSFPVLIGFIAAPRPTRVVWTAAEKWKTIMPHGASVDRQYHDVVHFFDRTSFVPDSELAHEFPQFGNRHGEVGHVRRGQGDCQGKLIRGSRI